MGVLDGFVLLVVSVAVVSGCNLTVTFPCDEDRCVPLRSRCDGYDDCVDGTDENDCATGGPCPIASEFRCLVGPCIPGNWVCDGQHDCVDESDEVNCIVPPCDSDQFQCRTDHKCIPEDWRCDSGFDCVDHSDEQDCDASSSSVLTTVLTTGNTATVIPPSTVGPASPSNECSGFLCRTGGACVDSDLQCDGTQHCDDGSDEDDCPTRLATATATLTPTTNDITITSPSPTITPTPITSDITTTDPEDPECEGHLCADGEMCIPEEWVCDGDPDCDGGSEEEGCTTSANQSSQPLSPCEEDEFHCRTDDTLCLAKAWWCDGDEDCLDGSDEDECDVTTTTETTSSSSSTSTSTTIPTSSTSSTSSSSTSSSTSSSSTCTSSQFQCYSAPYACIHWSWQCDGEPDCPDTSDELDCFPTSTTITATNSAPASTSTLTTFPATPYSHTLSTSQSRSTSTAPFVCDRDQGYFSCSSDDRGPCLPESARCDGGAHCADLSDELTCRPACNVTAYFRVTCPGEPMQLLSAGGTVIRLFGMQSSAPNELLAHPEADIMSADYHYRQGLVFWTDRHSGRVSRLDTRELSKPPVVMGRGARVEGVAVDWVHGHVYWVDAGTRSVMLASLDGSLNRTLVNGTLTSPRAIAVHPGLRYLYFSDWGTSPGRIYRSNLNGQSLSVIVTDIGWPNAITIDYEESRLYWVDGKTEKISHSSLDGSYQEMIVSPAYASHPITIAVHRGVLLWAEYGWFSNAVYQMNITSARAVVTQYPARLNPNHLMFYHPARQYPSPNLCGVNNGGCGDFCLPEPEGSISCLCRDGFVSHPSNPSHCVPEGWELEEETRTQELTTTPTTSTTATHSPTNSSITKVTTASSAAHSTSTPSATATTHTAATGTTTATAKDGGVFYMLLMGFKAQSQKKAISMFEILKNAARNASNNNLDVLQMA